MPNEKSNNKTLHNVFVFVCHTLFNYFSMVHGNERSQFHNMIHRRWFTFRTDKSEKRPIYYRILSTFFLGHCRCCYCSFGSFMLKAILQDCHRNGNNPIHTKDTFFLHHHFVVAFACTLLAARLRVHIMATNFHVLLLSFIRSTIENAFYFSCCWCCRVKSL